MDYSWTWIDGEDADEGNSWIQITDQDGEEFATIMCRDYAWVATHHKDWILQKESAATKIVDALNFFEANDEYVSEREA